MVQYFIFLCKKAFFFLIGKELRIEEEEETQELRDKVMVNTRINIMRKNRRK